MLKRLSLNQFLNIVNFTLKNILNNKKNSNNFQIKFNCAMI